jgi:transposase InsO family protein
MASVRLVPLFECRAAAIRHAAEPSATKCSDLEVGDLIQAIFKRHRRRYGYRRIWQELADRVIICAADHVRRIMIERGLKAI